MEKLEEIYSLLSDRALSAASDRAMRAIRAIRAGLAFIEPRRGPLRSPVCGPPRGARTAADRSGPPTVPS